MYSGRDDLNSSTRVAFKVIQREHESNYETLYEAFNVGFDGGNTMWGILQSFSLIIKPK